MSGNDLGKETPREAAESLRGLTRRDILQRAAALGVSATALPALLAACGGGSSSSGAPSTSSGSESTASAAASTGTPKPGGHLTVAYVGGGAAETLDPALYIASIDNGRGANLYDKLARLDKDANVELDLAEAIEPNADATEWTFRLRDGVTWHDGSPLTADDLLFTLNRIAAPKSTYPSQAILQSTFDLGSATKMDQRTLRVPLIRPFADVPGIFVDFWMVILKDGTTSFTKPIGTGPFVFDSFTPGQRSLFKRNPNYWRTGQPYFDELEMQSVPDANARLSALQGGQVQAMELLTFSQAKQEKDAGRIVVLEGKGPINVPLVMSVTQKPFDDVRVIQAMKLIADRPALVNTVQLGFGEIGNDLYGKGLEFYNSSLAQREQDIEQAKSLLTQAGASGLKLTLTTGSVAPGMLESAQVYAQQAQDAGVTITLDQKPGDTYWSDGYLKTNFFQTEWLSTPIAVWMQQAFFKGAIWNETAWDRPAFEQQIMDAQSELDKAKAADKWNAIQQTLWNESGYIFWGFYPWLDGIGTNVRGAVGNPALPLGAHTFREWWFA